MEEIKAVTCLKKFPIPYNSILIVWEVFSFKVPKVETSFYSTESFTIWKIVLQSRSPNQRIVVFVVMDCTLRSLQYCHTTVDQGGNQQSALVIFQNSKASPLSNHPCFPSKLKLRFQRTTIQCRFSSGKSLHKLMDANFYISWFGKYNRMCSNHNLHHCRWSYTFCLTKYLI